MFVGSSGWDVKTELFEVGDESMPAAAASGFELAYMAWCMGMSGGA